ncbi:MAG: sortase [Gudongella sp.]|nr:sortase [Gudongella sp.]
MKKWISTLLIVLGAALIAYQFLPEFLIKRQVEKGASVVEEITEEQIRENNEREAEYDFAAIEDVSATNAVAGVRQFKNENVIGLLTIDDLGIDLPILKGVSDANLMAGAGTMVPDIRMGEGNFPLASHYMKDPSLLFGNLLNAEPGMQVRITDKINVYEYEIYETLLVPETALYMLDHERADERGKPIISLMTCYYTSKNGKRFFALGELVDSYPYRQKTVD